MARMKKVDLVAKIAKEQNLDPEALARLPMLELEKMDMVVPDSDGSDILADEVSPIATKTKVFLGYHPISGAEVFAE